MHIHLSNTYPRLSIAHTHVDKTQPSVRASTAALSSLEHGYRIYMHVSCERSRTLLHCSRPPSSQPRCRSKRSSCLRRTLISHTSRRVWRARASVASRVPPYAAACRRARARARQPVFFRSKFTSAVYSRWCHSAHRVAHIT